MDLQITEVTVTMGGGTEQYNLMIAAGNYCDILPTAMYTGGAAQAYADEAIIDLTADVPEYAPAFYAQFTSYSSAEQYLGTVDGMMLYLPYIQDFYTGALGFETAPLIGGGNMAYWFDMADHMASWYQYSDTGSSDQILKWVTGAEVLDEASWAGYCDALESLGLSSCVAVYQTAYDDYLEEFGA